RPELSIDDLEADFKNIKQNNHLQTSFTAGNAMRPRQRMRTLRTILAEGKGFFHRLSFRGHAGDTFSLITSSCSFGLVSPSLADTFLPWPETHSAPPEMAGPNGRSDISRRISESPSHVRSASCQPG
ncbi:hypothetical protein, partial [Cobetia sp. 5-25-4-2]|uniref:hypothetical protein n=1 Tax=Cobetia sp. 5-25-4-2 TaxID=2737459 RepID=UPI001C3F25AD